MVKVGIIYFWILNLSKFNAEQYFHDLLGNKWHLLCCIPFFRFAPCFYFVLCAHLWFIPAFKPCYLVSAKYPVFYSWCTKISGKILALKMLRFLCINVKLQRISIYAMRTSLIGLVYKSGWYRSCLIKGEREVKAKLQQNQQQ